MNIKRFCEGAPLPVRKTEGAIGYDLPSGASYSGHGMGLWDPNGNSISANHEGAIRIPLCWGFEIPPGHKGELKPRSSTAHWLLEGVIDPDYRGQLFILTTQQLLLHARPSVKLFDRIAQLIIVPVVTPELVEVDSLTSTARGEGGFGSTGR